MITTNVLGYDSKNQSFFLNVMRNIVLEEKFAPMNLNLFYNQFFNKNLLDDEQKEKILLAKTAWVSKFKNQTYINNNVSIEDTTVSSRIEDIDHYKNVESNHLKIKNINDYIDLPNHLPESFRSSEELIDNDRLSKENNPECIIFESPFAGDINENTEYASRCIRELLMYHNKAPMASHLIYTRFLNDFDAKERQLGIDSGLLFGQHASETIIAVDRGLSKGMEYGIINAINAGRKLTFFSLTSNKTIQKELSEINSLEDIKSWIETNKSLNKELFNNTGFIF